MKKALFLCTGNSCRSQMAESFLRVLGKGEFESHSAGTFPKEEIHPLAVKVMQEKGIDISHQKPKALDGYINENWDYLITVCDNAKESCPVFPQLKGAYVNWSFFDPAEATGTEEEQLKVFRTVRDQIEDKISNLLGHPLQKES